MLHNKILLYCCIVLVIVGIVLRIYILSQNIEGFMNSRIHNLENHTGFYIGTNDNGNKFYGHIHKDSDGKVALKVLLNLQSAYQSF